jgi:hypothetical protein
MWHGWCSNYLPILTSNTTDATSRPEITYPSLPSEFDLGCSCTFCPYTCRHVSIQCCAFASGAPVFISGFWWGSCYSIVIFFCVCRLFFVLLHFFFGHCVACSSSIYGFWLPLWYLQTLLVMSATISVYIHARFVSAVDCFVEGAYCIYAICIYLRILISISDDVRVDKQ